MENNNQPIERKSWFKHNWIWALPVGGCLTVIVLTIVLMVVGIYSFADEIQEGIVTEQAIIDQGLLDAQQNQEVIAILGEPIEINGIGEHSVSVYNGVKSSIVATPIIGPNGEATIHISISEENDIKTYNSYLVVIAGTNQEIDLKPIDE